MAIYPSQSGGGIGALLRLIQEEKSSSIAGLSPQAEAGSPLRGTIQEPLKSPEAQGTTRVVSLRPEGVTSQQGEIAPEVIAPVAPVAPIPTPVPTPTPSSSQGPSAPSSQPSYTASPSMPSIGTKLVSSMVSKVLGAKAASTPSRGTFMSTPSPLMPTTSKMGPIISPGRGFGGAPTPTPSRKEIEKTTPGGLIPKSRGGFYYNTNWGKA